MTHEELQSEIPALVAGRLDAQTQTALELHAADCKSCRETIELWTRARPAFSTDPAQFTDPHPENDQLREFAIESVRNDELTRHVESCAQCSLVVQALRRPPVRKSPTKPRVWLSFAAGLFVGAVGLWIVLQNTPAPPAWSGQPDLLVLQEAHRGVGGVIEYTLEPGQPVVPIALEVEWSIDETRRYVASIQDSSGEVGWEMELSSATLLRQSMTSLPCLLVPTEALPPGLYELQIAIDGELVSSFAFSISR